MGGASDIRNNKLIHDDVSSMSDEDDVMSDKEDVMSDEDDGISDEDYVVLQVDVLELLFYCDDTLGHVMW